VATYLSHYKGKTINSVYIEKTGQKTEDKKDIFHITRGYEEFITGKKCLVVEDIITTGSSVKTVINLLREKGGIVEDASDICNRGGVKAEDIAEDLTLTNLSEVQFEAHDADKCPECAAGIPINTKLGHGRDFLAANASAQ
jgi:orotate phosphoribosyltransferase